MSLETSKNNIIRMHSTGKLELPVATRNKELPVWLRIVEQCRQLLPIIKICENLQEPTTNLAGHLLVHPGCVDLDWPLNIATMVFQGLDELPSLCRSLRQRFILQVPICLDRSKKLMDKSKRWTYVESTSHDSNWADMKHLTGRLMVCTGLKPIRKN